MDVMDAIKGRRSVRNYSAKEIEEAKLNLVLEAGRLSPSAINAQNWHFILVRDQEKLQLLMEAANGQPHVGEAPAAIVACATSGRVMNCGQSTDTVDVSIAMSYMILEAYELGLGTCWLGNFSADKVKKVLEIPEDVTVIAMTPIGYPAVEPEQRGRKELNEIVSYEKY